MGSPTLLYLLLYIKVLSKAERLIVDNLALV